jgi:hypothetical protein
MVAAKIGKLPWGRPPENCSIEQFSQDPENAGVSLPDAQRLLNVGRSSVQRARVRREPALYKSDLAPQNGNASSGSRPSPSP